MAAALTTTPLAAAEPAPSILENTGFSSENVEWVSINPQHAGTSGGKLVGKYYYLTDPRGLFIYDTSKPEAPVLVGQLEAPQIGTGAALAQEDPDTRTGRTAASSPSATTTGARASSTSAATAR